MIERHDIEGRGEANARVEFGVREAIGENGARLKIKWGSTSLQEERDTFGNEGSKREKQDWWLKEQGITAGYPLTP